MNILQFLSLLTVSLSVSVAISVDCEFKNFDASFGELYTCEAEDLRTSDDDNSITDVFGDHEVNKTNDDVKQFYAFNQSVEYFPGSLKKHFPNLESIVIRNSSLKFLYNSDLARLSELKYFDVSGNEIEVIAPKLFEDNSELRSIHFENNKITSISEDVLDPMNELEEFNIYNNVCVQKNSDVKGFLSNMNDIKKNIMEKCPMKAEDLAEAGEKQVEKLFNQVRNLEDRLEEELKKDKKLPEDEEQSQTEILEIKIEKLESEKEFLETDSEVQKQIILENTAELATLKEKLKNLEETSENLAKSLNKTMTDFETLEAKFISTNQEKDEKISTLEENLAKTLEEKKSIEKNFKSTNSVNQQLKKALTKSQVDQDHYESVKAELKKLKAEV